ncbi:proprotein convertase subtilisin/kexin type 7 isoform X2 [Pimephales promelas]|uniref:proprotein convertase subtilisin/kexin type 7 isoform X2 n=1 Tax=Pimephales promelas TaxID=90988 RepID=UPI001955AC27|nr:proprotein convertase subtilisin/kexin type 7 isoform X2 [Pimephales promelas]
MAPGQKCVVLLSLLLLSLAPLLIRCSSSSSSCGPGLSWAVRLRSGSAPAGDSLHRLAQSVAQEAGLQNRGQIGQLEGHYLLCPGPEGGVDPGSTAAALDQNPHVLWHSREQLLRRSKRSLTFNDPRYPSQWHLSPEGSYDLNSDDPDPMPHPDGHSDNHHGTRCAGEIAAVSNNSYCAVGVAYGGRVAGIRVLDGPLTDSMEAVAFNKHYQVNHIYSCSWGPDDDGRTVDGPHPLGKAALQHGVIAGRKGFGSIFVVASGNGGQYGDNCNYDGYANSIYTVTIGAVDENGRKPFYAEECASMLAVTFSSGSRQLRSIVTSDWSLQSGTGCTDGHTGTSAAAPLAAGMVALMLQVRPCLSWRDVQHIITFTATQHDAQADWRRNGAGFHHSHMYGFGLLNAWRLVNAAKVWESVPFLVSYQSPVLKANEIIPAHPNTLTQTWNVTVSDLRHSGMQTLEHVSVTVTLAHPRRGNVEVTLVCPSGMTSLIGARRALDVDTTGLTDWTFSTVRCWGERAEGQYSLQITDYRESTVASGVLKHWKLTLYGSSLSHQQVKERRRVVEEAMGGQYLHSGFALPCPPGIDVPPEPVSPFTSSSLKSLLLLGCFALFWALYYTLEVTLTHWDRGSRGRALQAGSTAGLEDSQVVEIQPEMDSESKVPLIAADENT